MASDSPENAIVARMMGIERYRALSTVWLKSRIGLVRADYCHAADDDKF